ncbi:MAG: diacylglycerol kinase family lipid kinase [Micromonosporaceae bacterium]|jgi:diacylglycerol kinase family enzyme|nr:diacylglycerol kinase family lipid kinase [Micromonosporaceae bacterium]
MRALLVVNPMATTTTERGRDVLVRALRSAVEVEVAYTRRRGHAASLARQAAESGVDFVVTLGGDGTVNEAVNGIMGASSGERPALAVVPGGSTNVFARALGLPKDWAEATGVILEALREGRSRLIGLGLADDRYFTFCAGLGLDAAVIRRVEQARLRGRVSTPALYLRSTARQYLRDWAAGRVPANQPAITLERPAEPPEEKLATVIVQNTSPWTYLGNRAINPNPEASFDLGLDVMALRGLNVPSTTRTVTQLLSRRDPHGKHVLRLHDVTEFTLHAGRAQPFQLDGDYLGEREKVRFTAVAEALRVIC